MKALGRTLRMIRIEHSVFALPFALSGAWLAAAGAPPVADLVGIVGAAAAARSAAMAFNRWSDRAVDALNPRTRDRELVTGALSPRFALAFTAVCAVVFVATAWWLAPLCGLLALPVLGVLLGYSRLKHHTWLCHAGLGLALGCAPAGAWLAVSKDFLPGWEVPLWVGAGVVAWTTGFDLLYAIQDLDHDRRSGLHSLPARFGSRAARAASALAFVAAVALWAVAGRQAGLGGADELGLGVVAALLLLQQGLVAGGRVDRIPLAFFRVNAWVGVVYFLALWRALPGVGGEGTLAG